jgi:hypothetical protein
MVGISIYEQYRPACWQDAALMGNAYGSTKMVTCYHSSTDLQQQQHIKAATC